MAESDGFVRNFRSAYYGKVGCCGIEEEKAVDTILNSNRPDIERLSDFCSRFDLARRREEVWKLLLGVQCYSKNPFDDGGKVVNEIRNEHFKFLLHHIEHLLCHNVVIRKRLIQLCSSKFNSENKERNSKHKLQENDKQHGKLHKTGIKQHEEKEQGNIEHINIDCALNDFKLSFDIDTTNDDFEIENMKPITQSNNHIGEICNVDLTSYDGKIDAKVIEAWSNANKGQHVTFMYLLESGRLNSKNVDKIDRVDCHIWTCMASIFVRITKDLQTAFFLFKSFLKKLEQNEQVLMMHYKQSLTELAKDNPKLEQHIRQYCSNFDNLPCWYWFRYCYIDVLDEKAILRLWDKTISGCLKCTPKIFRLILFELEPMIMSCNTQESILQLLTDKEKYCLKDIPQNLQP